MGSEIGPGAWCGYAKPKVPSIPGAPGPMNPTGPGIVLAKIEVLSLDLVILVACPLSDLVATPMCIAPGFLGKAARLWSGVQNGVHSDVISKCSGCIVLPLSC